MKIPFSAVTREFSNCYMMRAQRGEICPSETNETRNFSFFADKNGFFSAAGCTFFVETLSDGRNST